jgi:hypothetical protein
MLLLTSGILRESNFVFHESHHKVSFFYDIGVVMALKFMIVHLLSSVHCQFLPVDKTYRFFFVYFLMNVALNSHFQYIFPYTRFEDLMAETMKINIFWDQPLCRLVEVYFAACLPNLLFNAEAGSM